VDMSNKIKQMSTARQKADTQLQDYEVRLAELERDRNHLGEKSNKLQVSIAASEQVGGKPLPEIEPRTSSMPDERATTIAKHVQVT